MPQTTPSNKEIFDAVKNLLLPYMEDHNERLAFVRNALYGCNVLNDIDWSGSSGVFTVRLIEKLLIFGDCQQGRSAIVLLLEEIKSRTGIDKHTPIDALIEVYTPHLEINQTTIKSNQEPPVAFNIYEAIERHYDALDAKEWDKAQAILNEIRASGKRSKTFDIDVHERDLIQQKEYSVIQRMAKAEKPNNDRIWKALQIFWESYPGYDPDNLALFRPIPSQEYFYRAQQSREQGNDTIAIRDYTKAIQLNSQDYHAYHARGVSYQSLLDHDKAISDFTNAILLGYKEAVIYNNRGISYYAEKDYDRAIIDFNEAIRLNPHYAAAYNMRAHSYRAKKDYESAIADFNETIRINPHYAATYKYRGDLYHIKRDYDQAITDFNQAIQLDPQYAIAYQNRGTSYYAKGDYKQAIIDYEAALLNDSSLRYPHIGLQIAREALEQKK